MPKNFWTLVRSSKGEMFPIVNLVLIQYYNQIVVLTKFIYIFQSIKYFQLYLFQIDIDEDLLRRNENRLQPFLSDYLIRRPVPLKVQAFKGSIDRPNTCLFDTDAVIGIEV